MKLRKYLFLLLCALMCAATLCSCGRVTLHEGLGVENGCINKKDGTVYLHASPVYEAVDLLDERGKLVVTDSESYKLYTIPDMDEIRWLATEEKYILYTEDTKLPTLQEMAPYEVDICVDATTIHTVAKITDVTEIASLVAAFSTNQSVTYPGTTPLRNYRVRFESDLYPGFYYTLTYVEYGSDLVIDDQNYGKYFLYSAFDQLFVPVGDEIHRAMGWD